MSLEQILRTFCLWLWVSQCFVALTNNLILQSWGTAPLTPPGALHPHPALSQGTREAYPLHFLRQHLCSPSRDLNFFWLLGPPSMPLNQEWLPRDESSCSHQPATCQAHGHAGAQLGALPLGLSCGLTLLFLPFLASVTTTCEQCTLCAQACKTLLIGDLQAFLFWAEIVPLRSWARLKWLEGFMEGRLGADRGVEGSLQILRSDNKAAPLLPELAWAPSPLPEVTFFEDKKCLELVKSRSNLRPLQHLSQIYLWPLLSPKNTTRNTSRKLEGVNSEILIKQNHMEKQHLMIA